MSETAISTKSKPELTPKIFVKLFLKMLKKQPMWRDLDLQEMLEIILSTPEKLKEKYEDEADYLEEDRKEFIEGLEDLIKKLKKYS